MKHKKIWQMNIDVSVGVGNDHWHEHHTDHWIDWFLCHIKFLHCFIFGEMFTGDSVIITQDFAVRIVDIGVKADSKSIEIFFEFRMMQI